MKTNRRPALRVAATIKHPHEFVARLVLAELLAKRGEGPLERKALAYQRRTKR